MPIILNGSTLSNGGTINFNGNTNITSVYFGSTQVWKKEQQFSGGSVSWNNINKSNSGYLSSSMDLRGFSTITMRLNGYYAYSGLSGIGRIAVRYSNGTLQNIVEWTVNTTFDTTYTITLTGTEAQKNGARIYAETFITYEVATGVYNLLNATCGTITAR